MNEDMTTPTPVGFHSASLKAMQNVLRSFSEAGQTINTGKC